MHPKSTSVSLAPDFQGSGVGYAWFSGCEDSRKSSDFNADIKLADYSV
jgi:hypothetical protein